LVIPHDIVFSIVVDRFIIPNYHVILIHYPLGLFLLGLGIELFSFLWPRGTFRAAGRWMIGIGAIAMIPAAMSGMYALEQADIATEAQRDVLADHVWQTATATLLAVVPVVTWVGSSDRFRKTIHWPVLVLLILSAGLIVAGAWHAGEAVYRHGTGVAQAGDEDVPHGVALSAPNGTTRRASDDTEQITATVEVNHRPERGLSYFIPPLEGHLLSAGATVMLAAVAVGLSFRKLSRKLEIESLLAADETSPQAPVRHQRPRSVAARAETAVELAEEQAPPVIRFWALAVALGIGTALFGWWYLADATDAWGTAGDKVGARAGVVDHTHAFLTDLLSTFGRTSKAGQLEYPRRVLHVVNGVLTVVLMIALAVVARFAKRKRGMLVVVTTLLVLSIAAQVWVGTLLLYEGPVGDVTGWESKN
jgi:uncharacterized membrane protein